MSENVTLNVALSVTLAHGREHAGDVEDGLGTDFKSIRTKIRQKVTTPMSEHRKRFTVPIPASAGLERKETEVNVTLDATFNMK